MDLPDNYEAESYELQVDGKKADALKITMQDCCILEMVVATTGLCGGDAGHGGRTYISFKDLGSTALDGEINGERWEVEQVGIMVAGDAELENLANALKIASEFLFAKLEETGKGQHG